MQKEESSSTVITSLQVTEVHAPTDCDIKDQVKRENN